MNDTNTNTKLQQQIEDLRDAANHCDNDDVIMDAAANLADDIHDAVIIHDPNNENEDPYADATAEDHQPYEPYDPEDQNGEPFWPHDDQR